MNAHDKETHSKVEVLGDLEPVVDKLIEAHESKRILWFPSELLAPPEGEDPERHRAALRERARGIHDSARVAVGLNLLTEEGLPHFHRLLAQYLDEDGFWRKWNYLWTAEEDRHGAVPREQSCEPHRRSAAPRFQNGNSPAVVRVRRTSGGQVCLQRAGRGIDVHGVTLSRHGIKETIEATRPTGAYKCHYSSSFSLL